ncbi:hypothetical protein [Zavarzinella formosa]|uniref:hypothetical protein n=1 Tax=Zavarzinella formosa TaxID=360055 RepID=UPI00030E8FF8|nr:hypothetical protein [Zavarzinella formosa]
MPPEPGEFDLGAYVGVGLSSRQLYFVAGALFFGLFAFSAMRRAKNTGGAWAAVWGSAAIGLLAVGLHVTGRGLGDYLLAWLLPFTEQEPLQRAAILGILGCWAFVFLSAHWVNDPLAKWLCRLAGLGCVVAAAWLGVAWFRDEIPEEARPWTTQEIFLQIGITLGLALLAVALWMKGQWTTPHTRWAYRSLVPVVLGGIALLALNQFGREIPDDWKQFPFRRVILSLTAIGTACGLLIAIGAWFMRDQLPEPEPEAKPAPAKPKPVPTKPLPVAVLLDDDGRPVVPPAKHPS